MPVAPGSAGQPYPSSQKHPRAKGPLTYLEDTQTPCSRCPLQTSPTIWGNRFYTADCSLEKSEAFISQSRGRNRPWCTKSGLAGFLHPPGSTKPVEISSVEGAADPERWALLQDLHAKQDAASPWHCIPPRVPWGWASHKPY